MAARGRHLSVNQPFSSAQTAPHLAGAVETETIEFSWSTYFIYSFFFQGDLTAAYKEKDSKCVFLCVHDVGCNHRAIKVGMIEWTTMIDYRIEPQLVWGPSWIDILSIRCVHLWMLYLKFAREIRRRESGNMRACAVAQQKGLFFSRTSCSTNLHYWVQHKRSLAPLQNAYSPERKE